MRTKNIFKAIAFFSLMLISSTAFSQGRDTTIIDLRYRYPETYIIKDIEVVGATTLSPQTIVSYSGLEKGDKITIPGDPIRNAIRKIWNQKLVDNVEIGILSKEGNEIVLQIVITESPRILGAPVINGEIDFIDWRMTCEDNCSSNREWNNQQVKQCESNCRVQVKQMMRDIKDDTLFMKNSEEDDIIDMLYLVDSKKYTSAVEKNAKVSVDNYFLEKGYFNVKTNVYEKYDTIQTDRIKMHIDVNRGNKVKIDEIVFRGIENIPSGEIEKIEKKLKKRMKDTKEKSPLRIFSRSKFYYKDYKVDKESIITFLNSKGYRDAKIESDTVYNINSKLVKIEIDIDPGKRYYFRNIEWKGNYKYSNSTLDSILGKNIKRGKIYDQEVLDQMLNYNPNGLDISSLYLDDGYLFFSVNPVEVKVDGDSIDLEIRIYEGAQATIGRIYVYGNTKTSDHVIRRELRSLPGTKFSRTNLIRDQQELLRLQYFEPSMININPIPHPENGTVDIEYSLVEKPSDQLQLSGGWGGFVGFVGTLGLAFNNFATSKLFKGPWSPLPSGDGQSLNLRFQANGRQYQTYSLSLTEPWLGGKKPNAFTVSLSHSIQNQLDENAKSVGHLKVTGLTVSLGSRLKKPDDWFTLNRSISYLNYNIKNFNSPICETCNSNNVSFNLTISRNNVGSNPQFPTHGASSSLSVSATPMWALWLKDKSLVNSTWIDYHKWNFDNKWYLKLTGNRRRSKSGTGIGGVTERPLVLLSKAHLGFIGAWDRDIGVGPFERFILGGDGLSGAGFGSFLLGQDIIGLRGYSNNSIKPITEGGEVDEGGTLFSKFTMELRYPLVTEGAMSIYMLGFVEAGNNWSGIEDFNPFDLYRSVGAGLRLFMPAFGQIGIDYGCGLDDIPGNPGANGCQFHFTIGQQLR